MKITSDQARQIKRDYAAHSLAEFTRQAWPILEPSNPLVWNWHMDIVCAYLEAVASGRINRLIVNIAPGLCKSLLVSVLYPAFRWIKNPEERFLSVTNEESLAIRDALKMKNVVMSEWYQGNWPINLQRDQNEKTLFINDRTGSRQSQGFTFNVTGKRGSCITGDSLVSTEIGAIRIDKLCAMSEYPRVWSLNHRNNQLELKKILAAKQSFTNKTIAVTTVFGKALVCTPDHRIYTENGYTEAKDITGCRVYELQSTDCVIKCIHPVAKSSTVRDSDKQVCVYDIQVEGNHNFFANGILSHNCLLIDDPHSAKMANSDVVRQSVIDKFDSELITRVNDPEKSAIIIIMQRLHTDDLTGHLLKKAKSNWVHLKIPMRYEGSQSFDAGRDIGRPDLVDPRKVKGELMFPARFTRKVVDALEETLGEFSTAGQHQQRPFPAGGGIIKKSWWRVLASDQPKPLIQHQFCSYDTAFSERDNKNAAYSAMTRWGVFYHEQRERYCLLLLGCWYDRVGYDELRRKAKEFDKKYNPEIHLIEKKATGISLIQDLQRALPGKVKAYSPGKGEDKISRACSVSPMFQSGIVYVPDRVWAIGNGVDKEGVIDYVASFPYGAPHTLDITDTCTQALIYLRLGGWLGEHPEDEDHNEYIVPTLEDEEDEDENNERQKKHSPYGGW